MTPVDAYQARERRHRRRVQAIGKLMRAAQYLRDRYEYPVSFDDVRAARLLTTLAVQVFGAEVYWTSNRYIGRDEHGNLALVESRPVPRIAE